MKYLGKEKVTLETDLAPLWKMVDLPYTEERFSS